MSRRKLCVVTGSRADYGILYWLMHGIRAAADLELQVIATGMHLSPEFDLTYRAIEADGFTINAKVEMLLSSDSPVGVTKSIGLGVIGMADALDRLRPDILILLGDRYEILAAAQAALIARIPVAHIAGGDVTESAYDESIRHSITKMSHLHFVTHGDAAKRVRQLGEDPKHVYEVGNPGIDAIVRMKLLSREALEAQLAFRLRAKNVLVTFHPVTLDPEPADRQFSGLLKALEGLGDGVGIIFTKPNADTHGRVLMRMIDEFTAVHANACAHTSLGQLGYLSAVSEVDAVVGNSSSGLYEVPTMKKPTVNIGDRQKGRPQAASVLNCSPNAADIARTITEAFRLDCSTVVNPYGDGQSSERILTILKKISEPHRLIKKIFHEV